MPIPFCPCRPACSAPRPTNDLHHHHRPCLLASSLTSCPASPSPRFLQFAVPGDNSVDLFTNDLGIVVIMNDAGEVEGYNLLAGGGMGERSASLLPLRGAL